MTTKTAQKRNQFEIDVSCVRDDARKPTEDGAATAGSTVDVERLIEVLNKQHVDDLNGLLGN